MTIQGVCVIHNIHCQEDQIIGLPGEKVLKRAHKETALILVQRNHKSRPSRKARIRMDVQLYFTLDRFDT